MLSINPINTVFNANSALFVDYQDGVSKVFCESRLDAMVRSNTDRYLEGKKRLTKKQFKLLNFVYKKSSNPHISYNTHELNRILGNRQAYETLLRDRLFNLIPYVEPRERRSKSGHLIARTWVVTDLGKEILKSLNYFIE